MREIRAQNKMVANGSGLRFYPSANWELGTEQGTRGVKNLTFPNGRVVDHKTTLVLAKFLTV